jgi:hypothetical protein
MGVKMISASGEGSRDNPQETVDAAAGGRSVLLWESMVRTGFAAGAEGVEIKHARVRLILEVKPA